MPAAVTPPQLPCSPALQSAPSTQRERWTSGAVAGDTQWSGIVVEPALGSYVAWDAGRLTRGVLGLQRSAFKSRVALLLEVYASLRGVLPHGGAWADVVGATAASRADDVVLRWDLLEESGGCGSPVPTTLSGGVEGLNWSQCGGACMGDVPPAACFVMPELRCMRSRFRHLCCCCCCW
jgi:hypothetical protein